MSFIPIWVRSFTRSSADDDDAIADKKFRDENFIDYFGKFLQQGANATLGTFHELVTLFWNQSKQSNPLVSIATYVIADGAFVDLDTIRGDWFKPHVRILTVVTPKPDTGSKVFIVGPAKVKDPDTFLQVASFDSKIFRFYAYEEINTTPSVTGWTYQGNSWDAFASKDSYDSEYLGPFNGHVNGACIMKELHTPWYHWKSGKNTTFLKCIPKGIQTMLEGIPYLTGSGQKCFVGASVKDADTLEGIIEEAVSDWYNNRQLADFSTGPSSDAKPRPNPNNVQRWMAHLLLTTTINIGTSDNDGETFHANQNLFFNSELLSESNNLDLLPDLSQFDFKFDFDLYKQARNSLRLSLLQEIRPDDPGPQPPPDLPRLELKEGTLGGGKQTASHGLKYFVDVVSNTEGVPFVILQPSYEDAQGVLSMQSLDGLGDGFPSGLLSSKAVRALLMLDFWNPVYSWRRGVLMQYVPKQTTLTGNTTYDLEPNFVSAIRASSYAAGKQVDSPEHRFLQLYDGDDNTDKYQTRITKYLQAVNDKLTTKEGLVEYLSLAEARRRIYRPLPLDEFGVQLPYAVNLPRDWHYIEMTESGSTTPIPERGLDFLKTWTDSLAGFDPHVVPTNMTAASSIPAAMKASRCPMRKSRKLIAKRLQTSSDSQRRLAVHVQVCSSSAEVLVNPTWEDEVAALFSKPYWVADPESVGSDWIGAMKYYSPSTPASLHLDLSDKTSVQLNIATIYQHLRSKSMPITKNPAEYWPEDALETLRLWANQGFRTSLSDPFVVKEVIPAPNDPPGTMRVRKDLLSLSPEELQTYREKLDDVLQVGSLTSNDGSPTRWQELGVLHAEWCLHYQEATFLWHRAYLRYVEELIDSPIPYWNGFAADTADPNSSHAGLPSVFLEETYIHSSGAQRPNPLKYALSFNGSNKQGTGKYVRRFPELVNRDPSSPLWLRKVALFGKYHQQIRAALSQSLYSEPEDPAGKPWANLPAFTDNQDDDLYPVSAKFQYFDGLFEQAHDNYHGWVGPDMADNTYTAFDPIFLSYHANMDRIVEMYLRASSGGRQCTSNFPLQPFTDQATKLAYADSRLWLYTTLGDMAKDTKALQYMYAPPVSPDIMTLNKVSSAPVPRGGKAVPTVSADAVHSAQAKVFNGEASETTVDSETAKTTDKTPYVVFTGVACTKESFTIDVFVKGAASLEVDPLGNPDYIGTVTRVGMGDGGDAINGVRNATRCRKPAVTRVLHAEEFKGRLGEAGGVQQVVKELPFGKEVSEEEWSKLPGFQARLVWG